MSFEKNELNRNAKGGTELLMERLYSSFPLELFDKFQIIPSRVRELDNNKIRILYCHDLAEDPESGRAFIENGHERFHKIVFVSNWQMQSFINRYNIPWSKCLVIQNSIEPIEYKERANGPIKIIYHSTPHRGLNILVPVFEELANTDKNIQLDVYSSFKLYGWEERDAPYQALFDRCVAHPQINYHGSQPNDVIREALQTSDIFAYPSIWQETSCLCLIEAMAAGNLCIHPNYGALYETSAHWTNMYQFNEDINTHAGGFIYLLKQAISQVRADPNLQSRLESQSTWANIIYNWNNRKIQWEYLFDNLMTTVKDTTLPYNNELIFNTSRQGT